MRKSGRGCQPFLGQEPVLGGWAKFLPRFMKPLDTLSMEYQAQQAIQRLKVRTLQSFVAKWVACPVVNGRPLRSLGR